VAPHRSLYAWNHIPVGTKKLWYNDLELSRRLCIIKSSWATSRVKWLNGEKTNVSRTISVLVLRVLKWLEFPSVSYIYIYTCPSPVAPATSVLWGRGQRWSSKLCFFSPFNHLTRLVAREDFTTKNYAFKRTVKMNGFRIWIQLFISCADRT
jgi:hypothetical protein